MYRSKIFEIIDTVVCNYNKLLFKQIFKNSDYPLYKEFIFENPFKLDPVLSSVEIIKVYINLEENI